MSKLFQMEENMLYVQLFLAFTSPAWILAGVMFGVHKMLRYEQKVLGVS